MKKEEKFESYPIVVSCKADKIQVVEADLYSLRVKKVFQQPIKRKTVEEMYQYLRAPTPEDQNKVDPNSSESSYKVLKEVINIVTNL